MIMTTIDLADRLELTELAEDRIEILSHNRYVPDDQRNLAYQAEIIKREFNVKKVYLLLLKKRFQ